MGFYVCYCWKCGKVKWTTYGPGHMDRMTKEQKGVCTCVITDEERRQRREDAIVYAAQQIKKYGLVKEFLKEAHPRSSVFLDATGVSKRFPEQPDIHSEADYIKFCDEIKQKIKEGEKKKKKKTKKVKAKKNRKRKTI